MRRRSNHIHITVQQALGHVRSCHGDNYCLLTGLKPTPLHEMDLTNSASVDAVGIIIILLPTSKKGLQRFKLKFSLNG